MENFVLASSLYIVIADINHNFPPFLFRSNLSDTENLFSNKSSFGKCHQPFLSNNLNICKFKHDFVQMIKLDWKKFFTNCLPIMVQLMFVGLRLLITIIKPGGT